MSPTGIARIGPAHAQVRYQDFQICDEADNGILLKGPLGGWKRHQERGGNVLAIVLLASFKILLVPYTLFCKVRELRIIAQMSKVKTSVATRINGLNFLVSLIGTCSTRNCKWGSLWLDIARE